jgi:hypothetical protein
MSKFEYRVVPRVWEYGSKVKTYQTERSYLENGAGHYDNGEPYYPKDKYRHEVREVGPWKELDDGEDRT